MPREEGMLFDFLSSTIAQSSVRIPLQQTSHNALCLASHVIRESDKAIHKQGVNELKDDKPERIMEDTLIHQVHILIIEWR
jgi:hypothetical protein